MVLLRGHRALFALRTRISSLMQQRLISTPKAAFVYRFNRLPWNVSRGVNRFLLGRSDHRDATAMAQSEASVWKALYLCCHSSNGPCDIDPQPWRTHTCPSDRFVCMTGAVEREQRNCNSDTQQASCVPLGSSLELEQGLPLPARRFSCPKLDLLNYRPKALNSLNQDMVRRQLTKLGPSELCLVHLTKSCMSWQAMAPHFLLF